jgi:hypothetical protein
MNDCKHSRGFQGEENDLPETGTIYIIRCAECKQAIGVVPENVDGQIAHVEYMLTEIQGTIQAIYERVVNPQ